MIRLIKFFFIIINILSYILIYTIVGFIGGNSLPVAFHSLSFSMFVFIFGGLEKKPRVSRNEILLSFGLSYLFSSIFYFIYIFFFSTSLVYFYLLACSFYSIIIIPAALHFFIYRFIYRVNIQKILVIGQEAFWKEKISEYMTQSLGRVDGIDFCSPEEFLSDDYYLSNYKNWNKIVAISPSDKLYLKAKQLNLSFVSAGSFAEKHLLMIPLDILYINENHYTMTFEDIGIEPLIRTLDVFFAILILIFTIPVLIPSIVAIKMIDRMPILYRQERRGYRSRKFFIYKLTTMKLNPINGVYFVTSIGKILRKLRLNEVPQLLNVVKGEMSLVGPRPDIESTYLFCVQRIPYYHYRTNVLPGITGHAQVHYKYIEKLDITSFSCRLSYDLYYVKNHSIYLYLVTIMKTVGSVILLKGK